MNKKITECKACNGQVARKAKTCPHCGQKKPARSIKFSERSKPMQVLIIIGACFWGLIFIAIASAPDKNKEQENPHVKLVKERQFRAKLACGLSLEKSISVNRDSVKILMTGQSPMPSDEVGLNWKYTDTVQAKNAFNATIEKPFECHIYFPTKDGTVTYLKIGDKVVIDEK